MDDEPDKRAGTASNTDGARKGMGIKTSVIRHHGVGRQKGALSGFAKPMVLERASRSNRGYSAN